jgi:hypothetical protein
MALIGIAGHMGSGKDLTAKIIQYFMGIAAPSDIHNLHSITINGDNILYSSDWQIKHYADKLKQMASSVTGLPIETFYTEEGKNTVLPECWNYTDFRCNFVSQNCPVGQIWSSCTQHTCGMLENTNNRMTVREFMQKLGTDACRAIHPNFWINALFADYKPWGVFENTEMWMKEHPDKNPRENMYPNWLIPDTRFNNELQAIKDRGGITIRVERHISKINPAIALEFVTSHFRTSDDINDLPRDLDPTGESMQRFIQYHHKDLFNKLQHSSETDLDDYKFDYVVKNNGTIHDLINTVREVLIAEKLIQ